LTRIKLTKSFIEELEKEIKKNGEAMCPICGIFFDDIDMLTQHFDCDHQELDETLSNLSELAEENKETIDNWLESKKKELLLKIAKEEPERMHSIEMHPEELDKVVMDEIWKSAIKTERLSKFDRMWTRAIADNQDGVPDGFVRVLIAGKSEIAPCGTLTGEKPYSAEPYDYGESHKPDPTSGQSDITIPEPSSPEAKKVLDKKTPVNKVRFQDGKLVLEPEYEPERLPRNIKYAGNREELSDEEIHRKELLLVLTALMRKRKSN